METGLNLAEDEANPKHTMLLGIQGRIPVSLSTESSSMSSVLLSLQLFMSKALLLKAETNNETHGHLKTQT